MIALKRPLTLDADDIATAIAGGSDEDQSDLLNAIGNELAAEGALNTQAQAIGYEIRRNPIRYNHARRLIAAVHAAMTETEE